MKQLMAGSLLLTLMPPVRPLGCDPATCRSTLLVAPEP